MPDQVGHDGDRWQEIAGVVRKNSRNRGWVSEKPMGRPRKWPKSRTGGGVDRKMPDQVGHDGDGRGSGRADRRGSSNEVGDNVDELTTI